MTTETQAPDPAPAEDDLDNPVYGITDERINALIKASEVFEYHPGAILEFAHEVAKEAVADDFLRTHAIEELHQLGYTVKDGGRLVPPDHLHLLMQAARHPLAAVPAPEGAQLPEPHGMKWRNKRTGAMGVYFEGQLKFGINTEHPDYEWTPVYTADQLRAALAAPAPQAPVPMTDAEIGDLYARWKDCDGASFADLMRAVERHHGITQTKEPTNDR